MLRFTLKRKEILRGKGVFNTIINHGQIIHGNLLRAYLLSLPTTSPKYSNTIRVGFAVSKSVKRAVDRNRIKRLLRESYRLNKPEALNRNEGKVNLDIVFFFSPASKKIRSLPTFREIDDDVKFIIRSLPRQ